MTAAHLRVERFRAPADPREDEVIVELIAREASGALSRELATWPKPGLLSHIDNGSHGCHHAAGEHRRTEPVFR
jgi:triphosphoribosyl-dephospho-CoA synthase